MNIKQIVGVLAFIIIPIALVFIIHKSMQVDYGRGINQSVSKQKSIKSSRTSPGKKILSKASLEETTSKNRPKVVVAVPVTKDENKSGQSHSNAEQEKKKGEQYVSIANLIPKETYSYKYSPSKPVELVGSNPKASAVEKGESEDSAQQSLPESGGVQQILRNVTTEFIGEKLIITILANSPIKEYNHFALNSPPRYVIDLYGRWSIPGTFQPNKTNDLVKGIRFGLYPDKLRFVLDLKTELSIEPTIILSSSDMEITIRK